MDEKQIDQAPSDSESTLAIVFYMNQKRLHVFPDGDPEVGPSPLLNLLMDLWIDIKVKDEFVKEACAPLTRWANIYLRSRKEWISLTATRKTKALHEWYRSDYLKSRLWSDLRSLILSLDCGKCSCCENKADAVHHASYEDFIMRGLDVRYLWSLCKQCHNYIEFKGERKLKNFESAARLEELYKKKIGN